VIASQRQTSVRTLRVHSNQRDQLALRSRLARTLGKLDLTPSSLPPTAILCIRKLSDPAPGRLSADDVNLRAQSAWGEAIRARVASIAGRAARPALGTVPANSEAVLFVDRAELLACVAEDWCAGRITERWWWQGIYGKTDAARVAVTAWLETPEHIPSAMDLLARRQQALPFVQRLHDREVRSMQQALIRTFGLLDLNSALEKDNRSDVPTTTRADADRVASTVLPHRPADSGLSQTAPWRRPVPEIDTEGPDSNRRLLLGVGLTLQRDPLLARSASFALGLAEWYRASILSESVSIERMPSVAQDQIQSMEKKTLPVASAGSIGEDDSSAVRLPPGARGVPHHDGRFDAGLGSSQPASHRIETEPSIPPARILGIDSLPDDSDALASAEQRERLAEDASPLPPRNDVQLASALEEKIETELGGLFYLLNLALYLELYADFTRPLEPGISLPIWDFIALVGRRLLGDRQSDDPVWGLLARLAGRAGDLLPGEGFDPPEEWRMPADWLKPFGGQSAWRWSVDGERLRVRHPEGFYVLDVQIIGKRRNQLLRETEAYTKVVNFNLRRERRGMKKTLLLERWMNWLLPFISARLRRALGLNREEDLAEVLFKRRAHIEVTPTRLDVHLGLSDLPISIRLAGLDRDPGWVPAAGRFVVFHYQ
jgi:hypothetical protein